jgi:hypothetical protein
MAKIEKNNIFFDGICEPGLAVKLRGTLSLKHLYF